MTTSQRKVFNHSTGLELLARGVERHFSTIHLQHTLREVLYLTVLTVCHAHAHGVSPNVAFLVPDFLLIFFVR